MTDIGDSEGLIRHRINRGVAMLSLAEPPLNALSPRMIDALDARLDAYAAMPNPPALCLSGEGGAFSSGAEPEAARMTAPEGIARLCRRIEDWPRPVVAVLAH